MLMAADRWRNRPVFSLKTTSSFKCVCCVSWWKCILIPSPSCPNGNPATRIECIPLCHACLDCVRNRYLIAIASQCLYYMYNIRVERFTWTPFKLNADGRFDGHRIAVFGHDRISCYVQITFYPCNCRILGEQFKRTFPVKGRERDRWPVSCRMFSSLPPAATI